MKVAVLGARSEAIDPASRRLESPSATKDASSDTEGSPYPDVDAVLSVTADHRERKPPVDPRASGDTPNVADYAIGRVRDLFLAALDDADPERARDMARHLVSCGNPLPNATCVALGIPAGSSYGVGARAILAKADRGL